MRGRDSERTCWSTAACTVGRRSIPGNPLARRLLQPHDAAALCSCSSRSRACGQVGRRPTAVHLSTRLKPRMPTVQAEGCTEPHRALSHRTFTSSIRPHSESVFPGHYTSAGVTVPSLRPSLP
jgi:hypothetical protein